MRFAFFVWKMIYKAGIIFKDAFLQLLYFFAQGIIAHRTGSERTY